MVNFLEGLVKLVVRLYYKRTKFLTLSFRVDEKHAVHMFSDEWLTSYGYKSTKTKTYEEKKQNDTQTKNT